MMRLLRSLRKPDHTGQQSAQVLPEMDNDRYHQFRVSTLRGIITGVAICWMAAGLVVLLLMSTPFFAAEPLQNIVQKAGGLGMYIMQRMAIEMQYVLTLALPYLALWLIGIAIGHKPYTHYIQKLAAIQLVLHLVFSLIFVIVGLV